MSSLERTLRRKLERVKKDEEQRQIKLKGNGAPLVWAKMIYVCEDCGARFEMYLEETLERHNGKDHKPVPFGIRCKECGGFHCYDRSGLIPLPESRYLEDGLSYFKDSPKYDCGTPVHR